MHNAIAAKYTPWITAIYAKTNTQFHFTEQDECTRLSLEIIPRPLEGAARPTNDAEELALSDSKRMRDLLTRQPTDRCDKAPLENYTLATCNAFGIYFGQTCRCGDADCYTCIKVELDEPSFTTVASSGSTTTTKIPTETTCGTDPSFTRALRLNDPACK